jgi:hypothetical protein
MQSPLELEARHFQGLVEEVFLDEQGFIRGSLEQATRRPWRPDYFDVRRDFLKAPGLPPPHLMWAYEQTNMCHGFYLLSLVYQYHATGSPGPLRLARRTLEAIWRIYGMAPEAERGFLTKPYGGKLSRETHADQYFPVVLGLTTYYSSLATPEEQTRIIEMLTHFADWWMRQEYRLIYFGVPIEIKGRTRLNLLPLFGSAYQLSGVGKYRRELLKQLEKIQAALPLFGTANPPDRVRSPFGRYCGWFREWVPAAGDRPGIAARLLARRPGHVGRGWPVLCGCGVRPGGGSILPAEDGLCPDPAVRGSHQLGLCLLDRAPQVSLRHGWIRGGGRVSPPARTGTQSGPRRTSRLGQAGGKTPGQLR